jgi:proline iminopeptidase
MNPERGGAIGPEPAPADRSPTPYTARLAVPGAAAVLSVRDHGGSGPTVLLLHGGPGCPDYLEPVATMLPPDVRAVTFDQRGVGGSTCETGYRLEDYVADIEAIRAHVGAEQVHLLGHSWGGLLAQLYLREHPDRVASLCLLNSSAGVGTHWTDMEREVLSYNRRRAGPLGFAALGAWAAAALLPGPVGDLGTRRIFARVWRQYFSRGETPPAVSRSWLLGVNRLAARRTAQAVRALPAGSLDGLVGWTDLPVLSLYGDRDIYGASVEHLKSRFPAGRHVTIPGSGHLPWLQTPEAFHRVISDFYGTFVPRPDAVA